MPIDPDEFDREIRLGELTASPSRDSSLVNNIKPRPINGEIHVVDSTIRGWLIALACAIVLLLLFVALLRRKESSNAQTESPGSYSQPAAVPTIPAPRAETISGTITMVLPAQNLVFVRDSIGTSFKFLVTERTRIEVGSAETNINALRDETDKQVRVTFRVVRHEDVASSITVSF
jgi:hypothetical protein